jgi:hypothetical protein
LRQIHPRVHCKPDQKFVRLSVFIDQVLTDVFKVGRLLKNTPSDVDVTIIAFQKSFTKLRADFLAGINLTTVTTVLETQRGVQRTE